MIEFSKCIGIEIETVRKAIRSERITSIKKNTTGCTVRVNLNKKLKEIPRKHESEPNAKDSWLASIPEV